MERKMRRAFEDHGWFAIRSPGSSGGYDLIAAKDGVVLVIELKYRPAGEIVYFSYDELFGGEREDGGIIGVAEQFEAIPVAAVRWKQDTTFYGFLPWDLERSGKDNDGNPRVEPDDQRLAEVLPVDDAESLFPDFFGYEHLHDDEGMTEHIENLGLD